MKSLDKVERIFTVKLKLAILLLLKFAKDGIPSTVYNVILTILSLNIAHSGLILFLCFMKRTRRIMPNQLRKRLLILGSLLLTLSISILASLFSMKFTISK